MGKTQDPTEFPVYKELNTHPAATADSLKNGRKFNELVTRTGKTPRVVSYELKRLMEAGLIFKVEPLHTNGRDRRTKHIYVINKGWKWKEAHLRVMNAVAAHASAYRVYYSDASPYIVPGRGDVLVQLSLIIETPPGKKSEEYLPGGLDRDAMKNMLKGIDRFLKKHPDQWHNLLRHTVARIVTSQENNFFLVCYPKASFDSGEWPEPDWKSHRDHSISVSLTKRQRAFCAGHGYVMEALLTVKELPRATKDVWEFHVHGQWVPPKEYRRNPFAHCGHALPMRYCQFNKAIPRESGFLVKDAKRNL